MIDYLSQIPPIAEWGADTWSRNVKYSDYSFDIKELEFELTLLVGPYKDGWRSDDPVESYSIPEYASLITDFKTVTLHISSWSSNLYRKLYIFPWYDNVIFDQTNNNIEPFEINVILNDIDRFVKNKAFL